MTQADEKLVLAFDPWAGDMDSDAQTLRDKITITRTAHDCAICLERIPKACRVRAQTQVSRDEGKTMTFYFCGTCCAAMASGAEDDGESIESRYALGMANAEQFRQRAGQEHP